MAKPTSVMTEAIILAGLKPFGIPVPASFVTGVQTYIRLLLSWNEKVNLTSIREPNEILTRHFGESIFGTVVADIQSGDLLDVGSGAGFPALPIAMMLNDLRLTLLEPNSKKAAFLHEASRELGLEGRVKIVKARLEAYEAHANGFEFVSSRAVRVTREFLRLCKEQLRLQGKVVLWVGGGSLQEVQGIPGWHWLKAERIPGSSGRFVLAGVPRAGSAVPRETSGSARK